MSLSFFVLLILAYLMGAIPFSVWLGKWFFGVDPRQESDGNPGAANAFRAAGWKLGLYVLVLDFLKAFLPVFIARWGLQLPVEQLFWVMLMPTLGHAFSVFLGFRGGRAIVTLFGVWSGLTLYEMPLVMGMAAIGATFLLKNDVHRALMIPIAVIVVVLLCGEPTWLLLVGVAELAILGSKVLRSLIPAAPVDQPSHLKT